MTELELAKLALEMIAYPRQKSGSNQPDARYLSEIARVALVQMIGVKFDAQQVNPILAEVGIFAQTDFSEAEKV